MRQKEVENTLLLDKYYNLKFLVQDKEPKKEKWIWAKDQNLV